MQNENKQLTEAELELANGGAEVVGGIGAGVAGAGAATGAAVGSALSKGK